MRYLGRINSSIVLGTALLLSVGCASTQFSNFYMLSSLPESESGPAGSEVGSAPVLGIGPVSFPLYLDRPQIVMREGANVIEVAEYDRWAEPLKDNFTRVLAENLSTLVPTDRIALYPWPRSTNVDFQVAVNVSRFDTTTDGNSILHANWSILTDDGEQTLLTKISTHTQAAQSSAFAAIVAAMNLTLKDLSREIATEVQALNRGRADRKSSTAYRIENRPTSTAKI